MRILLRSLAVVLLLLCVNSGFSFAAEIRIATWNIEHLGSPGRGFGGGFGAGDLPQRTDDQLDAIAEFIYNELNLSLIAIQEVAITGFIGEKPESAPLERIVGKLNELGGDWEYVVATPEDEQIENDFSNLHCAFLINQERVRPIRIFTYFAPNIFVGSKRLFDRRPLIGYFDIIEDDEVKNDFVIVNVHLASGQENDENHLAAMVILEQNLNYNLKKNQIKESDKIIVGDLNDNPGISNLVYNYMEERSFRDLITEDSQATRMDTDLTSVIDHVFVNSSADLHVPTEAATVFRPEDSSEEGLAAFRLTFSDHFPVIFELEIGPDDDVDW